MVNDIVYKYFLMFESKQKVNDIVYKYVLMFTELKLETSQPIASSFNLAKCTLHAVGILSHYKKNHNLTLLCNMNFNPRYL